MCLGFPGGSDGKGSTCNAEDLGWKYPLEKGLATHFCILGSPWGHKELDTTEQLSLFHFHTCLMASKQRER